MSADIGTSVQASDKNGQLSERDIRFWHEAADMTSSTDKEDASWLFLCLIVSRNPRKTKGALDPN